MSGQEKMVSLDIISSWILLHFERRINEFRRKEERV